MRKFVRFLLAFLLTGQILGIGGLLALTWYYRDHFPVNTWINGVYCTGKSIEQINQELVDGQELSAIVLVDADDKEWEIDREGANLRIDFQDSLDVYLKENASTRWLEHLKNPVSSEITGVYVADWEKLRACLEALPFVREEGQRPAGARVLSSGEGYTFQDGNADRLDLEKAYAYLRDCLSKGQAVIDLAEGGCYVDLADTALDEIQRSLWRQICDFTDRCGRIVYDMGAEQIPLTSEITMGFLEKGEDGYPALDEGGNLLVSKAAVRGWVEELAAAYDTSGKERQFSSTRGDLVTVKYVNYGTKLDVAAEEAYLLEALASGQGSAETHIPAYVKQGYARGLDDIGGTYIEIDMTQQKMYYYVDRELELETDVITGNTGRRMGTPQGINFVYNKEQNRTLRGPGYAAFVKYWVPFIGAVGIHDASWKSKFGGELYKTSGSHGCINTPTDVMSKLYEMVEVGTPVITFY